MSSIVTRIVLFLLCIGLSFAILYREVVVRPRIKAEQGRQEQIAAQEQADQHWQEQKRASHKEAERERQIEAALQVQARAPGARRAAEPYDDGRVWLRCDLNQVLRTGLSKLGQQWSNDNIIIFPSRDQITSPVVIALTYDWDKNYDRFDGEWDVAEDYISQKINIAPYDEYAETQPVDWLYQKIDRRTLVMTIEHDGAIEWRGQCKELAPALRPKIVEPKL